MLLASQRTAHFAIVIPERADPAELYAAEELQRYVDRMANAWPSIIPDTRPFPPRAILLGPSRHAIGVFPSVAGNSATRPAGDGYVLKTVGNHIIAVGGSPRGTLYAAYDLLERLGVRWWTPDAETVPVRARLEIDTLDVRADPPLMYRATWYRDAMDAAFQARMRLNAGTMGPVYMQPRHGGMVRFAADATGHTYSGLVPADTYFDAHPEYYSEVNGKRLRHMNQLCPTNPVVADIAARTASEWLNATPGCNIVSVTQNDHGNWCTCKTCAAMIEKTGAPSGPALFLANEVARRLEKTHPNALVDTFAYAWTETAPRGIEAHPNVLVRIAPIGNCFGHTIQSCPVNERCHNSVKAWSKIARHLFVWHYVTDFFHYMTPFPNLPPLEDDIHFYLDHRVKGMFMQGNGNSPGGDMAELKTWLIARLLWNPSLKAGAVRAEFLEGYYHAASDAVQDYMALFEKAFARAKSTHLLLYRTLWENDAAYLVRPVLRKARTILQSARRAADGDDAVQARLDRIEAGLNYTDLFYYERPGQRVLRGRSLRCPAGRRRQEMAKQLFATAATQGLTHYGEEYGRYPRLDELRRAWQDGIGCHQVVPLANRYGQAAVVPALGGRVISFGPAKSTCNYLGVSSPKTFGYPCAGGYEEYAERSHQSAGFCERFRVARKSGTSIVLQAKLDAGFDLCRTITLAGGDDKGITSCGRETTGLSIPEAVTTSAAPGRPASSQVSGCHLQISTELANPADRPLSACLRAHLEINLGVPVEQMEAWFLRGRKWERLDTAGKAPGGTWFEDQAPDGWFFRAPASAMGLWQRWEPGQVGAVFLGGIPGEPCVLALDLAHGRDNALLEPGAKQVLVHSFGWTAGAKPPQS